MPQNTPPATPPAERLAARICKLANVKGRTDAGPAIAELRRRANAGAMDEALDVAIERGWLRRERATYVVTPAGAGLGASRSGKRSRRIMPF